MSVQRCCLCHVERGPGAVGEAAIQAVSACMCHDEVWAVILGVGAGGGGEGQYLEGDRVEGKCLRKDEAEERKWLMVLEEVVWGRSGW